MDKIQPQKGRSVVVRRLVALARGERRLVDSFAFRDGPPHHAGGVLLNQLGYQVLRTLERHALWHLRPRPQTADVAEHIATLDRDGILVVPDFLPADHFAQLEQELARSREPDRRAKYELCSLGDNLVSEEYRFQAEPQLYPGFKRHLQENERLLAIVAGAIKRPVTYPPLLVLTHIYKPDPSAPYRDRNDDILHADRHYPFIKVFFYMSDVDETNGAYTYAPGSHRLSIERLRHEYEYSIRQAKLRRGRESEIPPELIDRGMNKIAEPLLRAMGVTPKAVAARKNTLIVSNNFGFHRRGDFTSDRPRTLVNLDFKYLESRARFLFPLIKRLPF